MRRYYYLAETATIGLTVGCRRTATTPRDILEHARITVENIVEIFFLTDQIYDKSKKQVNNYNDQKKFDRNDMAFDDK